MGANLPRLMGANLPRLMGGELAPQHFFILQRRLSLIYGRLVCGFVIINNLNDATIHLEKIISVIKF